MTRYINLCRNVSKTADDKPIPVEEDEPLPCERAPTRYQLYKETYESYNNTAHRKEFMKAYNANYRLQHSHTIECECGVVYKDISKYAHKKSGRHKAFVEKKSS